MSSKRRAEKARLDQSKLVGTEALYKRLDKKLANLEVDTFFYRKQLGLFHLRTRILRQNTIYDEFEISFLSSQRFDRILHELEHHEPLQEIAETSLELGKKALAKFAGPRVLSSTLLKLQHNTMPCNCEDCQTNYKTIWQVLKDVPEAGPLAELAIRSSLVGSLKNICLARVEELGLEQDSLPFTVRGGLESGELEAKGERALEILRRFIKLVEPKVRVVQKTAVMEEAGQHLTIRVWLLCEMKVNVIMELAVSNFFHIQPSRILAETNHVENLVDSFISGYTAGPDHYRLDKYYREVVVSKLHSLVSLHLLQENPDTLPQVDEVADNPYI